MDKRFERTEILIGEDNLEKLKNSSVAVFGVGGVGSFVAEALARASVGAFLLIDHDTVDISNVNRQIPALDNTLGYSKVKVMTERLSLINPNVDVKSLEIFCTPDNIGSIIGLRKLDYIIDAVDNVTAKVSIIQKAIAAKIPVISSMGAGNKLDPSKILLADISQTHTCPLARDVRKSLRKVGIYEGVRTVFSTEKPMQPKRQEFTVSGKVIPGSISFLPSSFGLLIASAVVNEIIS